MKTTKRDRWSAGFYWMGVAMTFAAILLVLLGNTRWISPVEHTSFPLAWKVAIVAVLAFLAGEICRQTPTQTRRDSPHSLDHFPHEI